MLVSNMPPIDRAEQSTAHEIQQAKVIDLNDRVLNLDNPDDKMISALPTMLYKLKIGSKMRYKH